MKRIISIAILTALLISSLTGCGSGAEPTETTTALSVPDMTAEEILDNFEDLMSNPALADEYTVTRLPADEIADTGETNQWLMIKDTLLGYSYMVGVFSDTDGNAYLAQVSTDNASMEYISFSLFCFYLYKAMGFPEMDAEAFYDTFGLVSREPEGSMTIGAWDLSALLIDDYLTFTAIYKAQ